MLKINNFILIRMLEIQLTSNQQVGGSSPPGIAMLSYALTPVFPWKLPMSCVADDVIFDQLRSLGRKGRPLHD